MKKFTMYLLFSLILGILSLPILASAQAITNTTNRSIPTDILAFVPCANGGAGEFVQISGPFHTLFHTTISNSNNITLKSHFQPQGVSGVGQTTGDKYQGTGVTQTITTFDDVDRFPFETNMVNNFRIIGQGPGNNFLVHETFHVTINADGETTAFIDSFSFACK